MSIRILALNTTMDSCSVALLNNTHISIRFKIMSCSHKRSVLALIQDLLYEQKIKLSCLDLIAYNRGPGSFNGIRFGFCIAQGLAFGANLPMTGISSLLIIAQKAWCQTGITQILVAIDARIGEIYWAEYRRDDKTGKWLGIETESLISLEIALKRIATLYGRWAIAGSAWQAYPSLLIPSNVQFLNSNVLNSVAEDMLSLASDSWQNNNITQVDYADLTYLHKDIEWKKLPGR
ncbi:tRNA (adenosine(37)-N6)-threonylcarbamoyltransferase complex dimerization subunit type 1 TsaB [Pantoea sp. Mhis]|uniref:tRNA (adenosine(37)-N6)-threonylcarbamoyltransferase complex dimerization subunit type 1 TsaB n=1 Tax=Pantoea sp. Mhis TaxID=2576759 RepID=UPI00135B0E73|nr:tRNA (adenosine(37)-N6)-threonylcarbamoyltransferase complex dimerization subunit type 1 TsaB [Pantoea sp. Mhis]MXP56184.1 tRNA (adenosine(37)-N6)-threonylcarbamoyltransferase complex dimerization subunit type 1 TsaB [Pantoea sp. Mhis]